MCLFVVKKKARIAKKDITVYKVVRLSPDLGNFKCDSKGNIYIKAKMFSEFYGFQYLLNQEFKTKMDLRKIPTSKGKYELEVHTGFHSWSKPRNKHFMHEDGRYVVVECIIPKGSRYYVGKHSSSFDNQEKWRVSNKIIINKILWPIIEKSQEI
jgi:hypothetical protein